MTITNEQVKQVVNLINTESTTLGAVVRNFVAIAESDETARYMLDRITGYKYSTISMSVNAIKMAVINAYPYKDADNTLLEKRDGIFIPIERYSGRIIARAYYNTIGETKKVDFKPATEAEIKQATEAKEAKTAKRKAENAAKKENAELLKRFYDEMMQCNQQNCWDTLKKWQDLSK